MRIHTNKLTVSDVYQAAAHAGGGDYRTSPVLVDVTEHGSRSHARAFNVSLTGTSSRRTNAGNRGAGDDYAATWDEWGMFLGELFRRDPNAAVPGVYDSGEHFRWATVARFDDLKPTNQHGKAGHKWSRVEANVTGRYTVAECSCGAFLRSLSYGVAFADLEA